jgi:hypothetical protein
MTKTLGMERIKCWKSLNLSLCPVPLGTKPRRAGRQTQTLPAPCSLALIAWSHASNFRGPLGGGNECDVSPVAKQRQEYPKHMGQNTVYVPYHMSRIQLSSIAH